MSRVGSISRNHAYTTAIRPFVDMDATTWDRVISTNLRGTFLCCREAFRIMTVQQKGVIINLSSLSGVKGVEKFPGLSAYNVSKAGVAIDVQRKIRERM